MGSIGVNIEGMSFDMTGISDDIEGVLTFPGGKLPHVEIEVRMKLSASSWLQNVGLPCTQVSRNSWALSEMLWVFAFGFLGGAISPSPSESKTAFHQHSLSEG
jgi:hypothetical protein